MNANELFIVATKNKFRFDYSKGKIGVEDLWDLTLDDLDNIWIKIDSQLDNKKRGLSSKDNPHATKLKMMMDIVQFIYDSKISEAQSREADAQRRAEKATIANIIAKKKEQDLENKSLDELQAIYDGI